MDKIGAQLHGWLRMQELFHALSCQRARPPITVRFKLDFNPVQSLLMSGVDPTMPMVLDTILCLTGTVREGQATTVLEYMAQTWPATWEPIAGLLSQILARPEGEMQACRINSAPAQTPVSLISGPMSDAADDPHFGKHCLPAYLRDISLGGQINGPDTWIVTTTGGLNYITGVAQQLGWLVATLKRYPAKSGLTVHSPYIQGFESQASEDGALPSALGGVCSISCESAPNASQQTKVDTQCWLLLFSNPVLMHGYPILQRLEKDTGLEMPLRFMASLIRTQHVVQWNKRIMMKGFNLLAVATVATAGVVIWHLLKSASEGERISYVDWRVEGLAFDKLGGLVLRDLENSRHILGWCPDAIEMCG
jgi:hypothetical protein